MNFREKSQLIKQYINTDKLTTDKVVQIICAITPVIDEVMQDKEIKRIWERKTDIKGLDKEEAEKVLEASIKKNILELIPIVLGRYRHQVYFILGVVNNKSAEEIANQDPFETLAEIEELIANKDNMGFSQSSQESEEEKL